MKIRTNTLEQLEMEAQKIEISDRYRPIRGGGDGGNRAEYAEPLQTKAMSAK